MAVGGGGVSIFSLGGSGARARAWAWAWRKRMTDKNKQRFTVVNRVLWNFTKPDISNDNKNALSSVESRLFVDKIRGEEANRARAFVIRRGGGGFRI